MKQTIYQTQISTPLGPMSACSLDEGLCMLEFALPERINAHIKALTHAFNAEIKNVKSAEHPILLKLEKQLLNYFNKKLHHFDLPIILSGTDFQKQTWKALQEIPYGQITTYGHQASTMGRPSAVRAVAAANGRNKISIIIPCHRVIGANGSLTGYGGELWRKKYLLELERMAVVY